MILFEKKNSPVKTIWLALLVCILGFVWGCSADYDEFGESPYCDFDEIHFAGEAEGIQVFADEHKVIITLEERSDSLAAWDSVTIESIDISHMASLHLVESKIIEFPTDSAGLDSLAKVLAYSEKKLKKGSKIRIPASQYVYVMVVAEDGTPSLWQIQFVIPGVEPASNESSESEEKNDSNEGSESKDSSEQGNSKETSQNIIESSKSSERGLALQFVGQSRLDTLDDTLAVIFPPGTDVSKIAFETWSVSDKASASPEPDKVTEWKTGTTITVTAEDGSTTKWYVRFSVAAATDVLSAVATGQTKSALIDESKGVVVLYLPSEAAKKKVDVDITLSEGATHDLSLPGLDLSSPVKFTVTASEDKREWTMSAEVFALPPVEKAGGLNLSSSEQESVAQTYRCPSCHIGDIKGTFSASVEAHKKRNRTVIKCSFAVKSKITHRMLALILKPLIVGRSPDIDRSKLGDKAFLFVVGILFKPRYHAAEVPDESIMVTRHILFFLKKCVFGVLFNICIYFFGISDRHYRDIITLYLRNGG